MNKFLTKIREMGAKKVISYIVTFVVAAFLGIGMGASGMVSKADYDELKSKYDKVSNELESSKNTVNELQAKVDEAKPFFEMKDAEKEAMKIETHKKEEENKKEQERIAKEKKKEEEAKKQAELDARSITLGNGTYLVGKDIPEGVYDLYAVKGGGNVMSSDFRVNLIMGVSGNDDFYQREEQNVVLKDGTNIELKGVTVKFVPDDGYVINN